VTGRRYDNLLHRSDVSQMIAEAFTEVCVREKQAFLFDPPRHVDARRTAGAELSRPPYIRVISKTLSADTRRARRCSKACRMDSVVSRTVVKVISTTERAPTHACGAYRSDGCA
jgi:hypothetical protein